MLTTRQESNHYENPTTPVSQPKFSFGQAGGVGGQGWFTSQTTK
uniref:Uncharacterized protein n=1 Tax=Rhizophora mucronata TaxID=61149 RepID=A0A2P2QWP9_RHIMU